MHVQKDLVQVRPIRWGWGQELAWGRTQKSRAHTVCQGSDWRPHGCSASPPQARSLTFLHFSQALASVPGEGIETSLFQTLLWIAESLGIFVKRKSLLNRNIFWPSTWAPSLASFFASHPCSKQHTTHVALPWGFNQTITGSQCLHCYQALWGANIHTVVLNLGVVTPL